MSSDKADEMTTVPTTERVEDLRELDEHLAHLYRQAAKVGAFGPPVVMTTLLNLIIYASDTERADQAVVDSGKIMGSHPSRVIILEGAPPEARESTATVTAVCGITERGDRQLCGDIIRVHIVGLEQVIQGSVMPLLVPDVPVVLWMTSDIPCARPELQWALDLADHVIVDSRRFENLKSGLLTVLSICLNESSTTLTDLTWISLEMWRELTAQHFDSRTTRPYLERLTMATVEYSDCDGADTIHSLPLLFTSWLIERLHLRVKGVVRIHDGHRILAEAEDCIFELTLVKSNTSQESRLKSVILQSGQAEPVSVFETKLISDEEVSLSDSCEGVRYPPYVLRMPTPSEAVQVSKALDLCEDDVVYKDALSVALDILARAESSA